MTIPKSFLIVPNINVRLLKNVLRLRDSAESVGLTQAAPLSIDEIANIYDVLKADI